MPKRAKVRAQSKQAHRELDLYNGKKLPPPVRHSSQAKSSSTLNWSELPVSQKLLILIVVSTVFLPVAVGENEYNEKALVLNNPYNRAGNAGVLPPLDLIAQCHFLFPIHAETIASDGLPAEGRTIACVQKLDDPIPSKFDQAIVDGAKHLQSGSRMDYLNVLNAWPKKDRKKLKNAIKRYVGNNKINPDPNPLINAIPDNGLIESPHLTSTLVSYKKYSDEYLYRFYLLDTVMVLHFHLASEVKLIAYQWLQEFMAIQLAQKEKARAAQIIAKMMRMGVALPRLHAQNALMPQIRAEVADLSESDFEINKNLIHSMPPHQATLARLMLTADPSLFSFACWMGQVELVNECLNTTDLTYLTLGDWVRSLVFAHLGEHQEHQAIVKLIEKYLIERNLLHTVENEAITYFFIDLKKWRLSPIQNQNPTEQPQASQTVIKTITLSPSRFSGSVFYHRVEDAEKCTYLRVDAEKDTCPAVRKEIVNKPARAASM